MPLAIIITTVVFTALCVACDLRARRIPNVLSLGGIVAGVALNGAIHGVSGLLQSGAGFVVAIALLLPAFAGGGIGGGDVKMMAALGALLGPRLAALGLLCGVIAGGILMLIHLLRIGRAREKLQSTLNIVKAALYGGSLAALKAPANDPNAVTLPYSVPLGFGVLLTLTFQVLAST